MGKGGVWVQALASMEIWQMQWKEMNYLRVKVWLQLQEGSQLSFCALRHFIGTFVT